MFPLARKMVLTFISFFLSSCILLHFSKNNEIAEKAQKEISASVSQVVYQLIDLLRDGHPEDRLRGCYHALYLISETYSFPANAPQLGKYINNKNNRKTIKIRQ